MLLSHHSFATPVPGHDNNLLMNCIRVAGLLAAITNIFLYLPSIMHHTRVPLDSSRHMCTIRFIATHVYH